jgi:flagellar biosynthetic protein FlhB
MSDSGEKTEKATPKRIRDARRKGQVAKSQDLTAALVLAAAVAAMAIAGRIVGSVLTEAMRQWTARAAAFRGSLDLETAVSALHSVGVTLGLAVAPLLITLLVISLLAGYVQVGSLFSAEAIKPDIKKLNPIEALKGKFFKLRPYIEMGKTLLKLTVTAAVIVTVLRSNYGPVVRLVHQPIRSGLEFVMALILETGWKIVIAFLVIGGADALLQRFLHGRDLRMSKQELKDEYKETEGKPEHKHALRHRHQEILMQNMSAAVKKADAVIVNPTHIAVALRYDEKTMNAPTVVAKGAELMAAQIRELAREAGVPVCRDAPLARALYHLEIDEEIPEELYEAVAVILRWVYELEESGKL